MLMTACSTGNGDNSPTGITGNPTSVPTDEVKNQPSPTNNAAGNQTTPIEIGALKGPTAIGMVKLMEDSESGTTANSYSFTVTGTADELTARLLKGELPIAALPCNLASVLYHKSEGKLQMAAINTLGVLYIVETGDSIKTLEDLRGKTIYSTGKGTTPEYALNYLLKEVGIDPEKDVTIDYKTEATEVAALLQDADNAVAMLPQPYVTTAMMNNDQIRIALDITKEWEKVTEDNSTIVTGVVLINKEFAEANKQVVDQFLDEYEASVAYVNENVKDAAGLLEKFDLFKAAVGEKAIPYCNIVFVRGAEMKTKAEAYLQTLLDQNPQIIGGSMPEEDFYLER